MPLTDWSRRERRIEQRTCSAAELSELTYASICGISGSGIGGLKLSRICALVVLPPFCCCCFPPPPPSAVGKEEAIEMGSSWCDVILSLCCCSSSSCATQWCMMMMCRKGRSSSSRSICLCHWTKQSKGKANHAITHAQTHRVHPSVSLCVSVQTRISWGMMILQLSISPHKAEEEEQQQQQIQCLKRLETTKETLNPSGRWGRGASWGMTILQLSISPHKEGAAQKKKKYSVWKASR